ncbi:MAG: acetoacetate decarboxylase family protein [Deltaproteobacteria bacterium]|nr:acetoacetate decarboxylase family protein [Deltaproteobacteria bacterium]
MANVKASADFYDARMLTVFWETKPEIISKLLPPPLEPAALPLAMAFVADYPATNFDCVYKESALFISASYNGEEGSYCLAMPVTSDIAMAGGREVFGFPKKMAEIEMNEDGETISGSTKRRGTKFMEIRASLTGEFNDPAARETLMSNMEADGSLKAVSYNFKHFPAPEGGTFDYNPRLVRQETLFKPKEIQFGSAEIIFTPSDYDPWAEVEVVKMLGAMFTVGDNSMLGGKAVAEVNAIEFSPYAFLKWDMI